MFEVNYMAVAVAGLVSFVIGWLWFMPAVFGKRWMKDAGVSEDKKEKGKKMMMRSVIMGLIAQLVAAYVMAHVAQAFGATGTSGALQLAFWVWLGFTAVPMLGMVIWEMKSWTYYAIVSGYWLVGFVAMALVLVMWK